jgi:P4 family phage/plasmid primase-like protien
MAKTYQFLDFFPNHVYRYIDQTGAGRPPVTSEEKKSELNLAGYESYYTVNGFKGGADAKKESCTNLNAFFIDIDGRKDKEELEAIKKKLDPTFIIETGRGHHIYWCLDEGLYKEDCTPEEWAKVMARWERIQQAIVTELKADPVVKDIPRILRVPDTYYWKKSGDAHTRGTEGIFKIKGIYKVPANVYSMDKMEETFPTVESVADKKREERAKSYSESERNDFFERVNSKYPIANRDSFKRLISGEEGTLPPNIPSRNGALLVVASLARQAGWTVQQAQEHFVKVGWHGIEKERGGLTEIYNTVNSAFGGGYTFSHKNEIIIYNMSSEEEIALQTTYTDVLKDRKEKDRVRFSNYENELLVKHPNLKKNEAGIIFDYDGGVYKMLSDVEISSIILRDLYDDMLWGYRTGKCVSDKLKCLLSIIPYLVLNDDRDASTLNLKNGLLNINTRVLRPHTPEYVSLIQSPVSYDPEATAPTWNECIKSWMEGDEAESKALMLQQFSGYTLTPTMSYDKALFLVGDGGNGKSTFVDTIAMVVGDMATSHIDLEDLYGMFGMQALIGKRLNVIEEVHGNYYQSNKLKKLISGESVTVNMKFKNAFYFKPQAKFVFAVNIMPRVDDTSAGMERRTCAIVFKNNFRNHPNTALRNSGGVLAQELSGILNWMLDGVKSLHETHKFVVTKEQEELLREYRQENSAVEGFIAECLDFAEGATAGTRELYDNYKEYCVKDGRKFKSNIGFTKEMKAHAKRYGKFTFVDRSFGGDGSKFEGVRVSGGWGRESNVNVSHYLNS